MAQRTQLIYSDNPGAIPASYVLPPNLDLELSSIVVRWDGTAASGTFYACLSVYSQDGRLIGRFFPNQPFAAGDSGVVTYAPFLGAQADAPLSPTPSIDDYVFKTANTTVTAVGQGVATNVIIQGNPIVLDGLTRIKVEFFCPHADLSNSPPNNQAVGFELWDGATSIGIIGYVAGNRKTDGTLLLDVGVPVKCEAILTPAAGTHTYKVCAFKNVVGGTCTVVGNTFVDGSGNFGPCWYRVTST